MRVKVIGAVLVYNGKTYHEGDYIGIENEDELKTLIQERCITLYVEEPKSEIKKRSDISVKSHKERGEK